MKISMAPAALAIAATLTTVPAWTGTIGPGPSGTTASVQPATAQNPRIAPIYSRPAGHSYSEWAARWWQWALQTPASIHPVNGGPCSSGQTGNVWFVGVNFSSDGTPIARSCTVPSGTALYVALINHGFFAFLNDPPEQRTEEFIRARAECTNFQAQSVRVDGVEIRNPAQYLERSVVFDVQLPVDNAFGVTEADVPQLKLSPSVDFGYYLFVRPLPVGAHEISWSVSMECPSFGGSISQNQTLSISVVPAGR